MKFSLKTNIPKIINDLEKKDHRALLAAKKGMIQGMQLFSSNLIKTQMTGRPGLRVRTGTLRRSWFIKDWFEFEGNDIIVRLATDTKYAAYHEESKPKLAPRIPKRLHVVRSFEETGIKIITKQIAKHLFAGYKA